MYPSTSSYRSSASTSRLLRRKLRGQEDGATDTTTDVNTINSRSRGYSHDHSTSGKSSVSSFSTSTASERRQKSPPSSYSDSPVMVFLRSLLTRCFTKRRKRRKRGLATRKMKNNNYQTRDDDGNVQGATNSRNSFASIPTNEHEMFFQLHSKSKNSKPLTGPPSPRLSYGRESIILNGAKPPARSVIPDYLIIEQKSEDQSYLLS